MTLELALRLGDADAVFAALIAAHEGLEEAASRQLDATLVLILANHIGDDAVVFEAIRVAREGLPKKEVGP